MNEYLELAWAVFLTVLSGIIYSVVFYAQAWKAGESFSGQKFLRTIIWGAVIGIFAFKLELSMPEAEAYMSTFGGGFLVIIIDQIAIIIWKRYGAAIMAVFGKKEEPPEPEKPDPAPPAPPAAPPTRGCPLNPPLAGK